MFCTKCGSQMTETARFCGHCGETVAAANHQAAVPISSQAPVAQVDPIPSQQLPLEQSPSYLQSPTQPPDATQPQKKPFNKLFLILPITVVVLIATVAVITLAAKNASGYQSSFVVTPKNSEYAADCKDILQQRLKGYDNVRRVSITITDASGLHIKYLCDSEEAADDINKNLLQIGKLNIAESKYSSNSTPISNEHIKKAEVVKMPDDTYSIKLTLTDEGSGLFAQLTGDNIGKKLNIRIDNKIISSPTVNEAISNGEAVITNIRTEKEAKYLCCLLNFDPLPCSVSKEFGNAASKNASSKTASKAASRPSSSRGSSTSPSAGSQTSSPVSTVKPKVWTETAFVQTYNASINSYKPKNSQNLTFLLVRADGCKMGVDRDDIRNASELTEAKLSEHSNKIMAALETLSEEKIRFTDDPDQAMGYIVYDVQYPFAGYYGTGNQVSAYSCKVSLSAFSFGKGAPVTEESAINSPGSTISITPGSKKSWRLLPKLEEEASAASFTQTILSHTAFYAN